MVELWPDNATPIQLFHRLATQWRVAAGGPIGLDYGVLFHQMDRMGLDTESYDDLFACVRIIEATALDEMHKKD